MARLRLELPEALSFEEGAAIACGTGTAYGLVRLLDGYAALIEKHGRQ
jgi:hypothetical protein